MGCYSLMCKKSCRAWHHPWWCLENCIKVSLKNPLPPPCHNASPALTDVKTWPGKTKAAGYVMLDISCDSTPRSLALNTECQKWRQLVSFFFFYFIILCYDTQPQCGHSATGLLCWFLFDHLNALNAVISIHAIFFNGPFVWKNLRSTLNSRDEEAIQQDELPHDCDDVKMNSSGAVADGVSGFAEYLNEFGEKFGGKWSYYVLSVKTCKIPVCVWCESVTNNSARAQFTSISLTNWQCQHVQQLFPFLSLAWTAFDPLSFFSKLAHKAQGMLIKWNNLDLSPGLLFSS